jgi:hypothetical protein
MLPRMLTSLPFIGVEDRHCHAHFQPCICRQLDQTGILRVISQTPPWLFLPRCDCDENETKIYNGSVTGLRIDRYIVDHLFLMLETKHLAALGRARTVSAQYLVRAGSEDHPCRLCKSALSMETTGNHGTGGQNVEHYS